MRDFHLPGPQPGAVAPMAWRRPRCRRRRWRRSTCCAPAAMRWTRRSRRWRCCAWSSRMSTGIGGDCFCLYAPAGAAAGDRAERLRPRAGGGRASTGSKRRASPRWRTPRPHAVTVPGAVSAWETLLEAHGTQGAGRVAAPGHRLLPRRVLRLAGGRAGLGGGRRTSCAATAPTHSCPAGGRRCSATASCSRSWPPRCAPSPGTARAPSTRARSRPTWWRALRARGGLHTEADFAAGRTAAHFVEPIRIAWNGYEVWQCPPNGSGLLVLMLLGMLGGFGPAPDGPLGVTRWHRHIEAARLAYRDRDAFLADPLQADVPVAKLTSRGLPRRRCARLIRDDAAMRRLPAPGEARAAARTATPSISASSIATAMRAASSTRCSRVSAPASWPRSRA